jgi:hypothetical protein
MCFPALAAVATIAGTAVSALGQIQAGKAQESAAEYNAQVAKNNASAEMERAGYDAGLIKDEARRTRAAQRAAFAANGLEGSTGSPVAVLGDTSGQAEMDILARLYGGKSQATAYGNEARAQIAQGKAAKQASMIGAGTTLLTGFGNMASKSFGRRYNPLGA